MRSIIMNSSVAVPKSFIPYDKDDLIVGYSERKGVRYGFIPKEKYWGLTSSFDYEYCGSLTPYELQKNAVQFMVENPRCFNFCSTGTGKTITSLWAADYLISKRIIKKVLIITTISNLQSTWADEIFINFGHRTSIILKGSKQQKLKSLAKEANFYIINHDGITTIADKINIDEFQMIIYDEASAIKNPSTDRFKLFFKYLIVKNPDIRIVLMTATPAAQGPMDAYGLIRTIYPNFKCTMTAFKELTMIRRDMHNWLPKDNWQDLVFNFMRPAIRFNLNDLVELPELTLVPYKIELTQQQKKVYDQLRKQLLAELETPTGEYKNIVVSNAAVLTQKLLQCLSGVIYNSDGGAHELDFLPRYQALSDIIENAENPVLVFTSFKQVQILLYKKLLAKFGAKSIALINGEITGTDRSQIINDFQQGKYKALLAHPKTVSHGVTLTRANIIVWYGVCYSSELYQQGNGRIIRVDSTARGYNKYLVYQFYGNDLELNIYKKLTQKNLEMKHLLTMIKGGL